MKYIVLTLLLSVGVLTPDIYNWSFYKKDIFYSKTDKSVIVYGKNGVKIYENNNFDILVFNPKKVSFGVSSGKPKNVNFYMNSNFFNVNPIGLVVIDGKKISNRVKGGGYFYVKNGVPKIGIKSCPTKTEYVSQSILWGIKNKVPNSYLCKQNHANVKTYRNMVGVDKYGNIIVIVSNSGGRVTIKDIIDEGIDVGIVNGVLFDGGSSVEYGFNDGNYSRNFKSLSSVLKKMGGINEPTTYIYCNLN